MDAFHQIVEHLGGRIARGTVGQPHHRLAEGAQRLELARLQLAFDAAHHRRLEQRHLGLPGEGAQHLQRGIADPAPRRGDRADKGRIVVGIGDQPQIGADVLDLGLVEEALPAGKHIRDALAAQDLLEQPRLVVAAIEDRVVAELRAPLELVRRQLEHHRLGLVLLVVHRRHGDRVPHAVLAPQRLVEQLGVVGDHRIGGLQDAHRRAIVLLELDDLQVREVGLQQAQIVQRGAAPAVDRLVVVADRGEGGRAQMRAAGQQLQQLVLAGVGVLVFVDEEVAQPVLPLEPHGFVACEQLGRQPDQVVEVDRLVRRQRGDVVAVDQRGLVLVGVGGLGDRGLGIDHAVLPQRDRALHAADQLLVSGGQLLLDQAEAVIGVHDRELRLQAQVLGLGSQDLHAQRVEGADGQLAQRDALAVPGLALHQLGDPLLHFLGGLVGEGHRGDVAGLEALVLDQMRNLLRDHPGLARTRASEHQAGAVQIADGFGLGGVQSVGHRSGAEFGYGRRSDRTPREAGRRRDAFGHGSRMDQSGRC